MSALKQKVIRLSEFKLFKIFADTLEYSYFIKKLYKHYVWNMKTGFQLH